MSFSPQSSVILTGTLASRPSPNPQAAGRMYFATDSQLIYRDTGAAWTIVSLASPGRTMSPPTAASFAGIQQTGTNFTLTDANGILYFEGTKRVSGADDRGLAYKAVPTSILGTSQHLGVSMPKYYVEAAFRLDGEQIGFNGLGSYFLGGIAYGDGTRVSTLYLYYDNGALKLQGGDVATLNAVPSIFITDQNATQAQQAGMLWLRMEDDGNHPNVTSNQITWSTSVDGVKWRKLRSQDRWGTAADTGVPSRGGILLNAYNSDVRMHVFHMSVTAGAPT